MVRGPKKKKGGGGSDEAFTSTDIINIYKEKKDEVIN